MVGRIIIGVILIALGVLFVVKSEWFFRNIGMMGWAERFLGSSGGSRLGYKLIGLALILIGILIATNLMAGILMSLFSKIFKGTVTG